MLTFEEQAEIMRLAKNLVTAGVKRNNVRESHKRTGTPVTHANAWFQAAEDRLKDYLKEVG